MIPNYIVRLIVPIDVKNTPKQSAKYINKPNKAEEGRVYDLDSTTSSLTVGRALCSTPLNVSKESVLSKTCTLIINQRGHTEWPRLSKLLNQVL